METTTCQVCGRAIKASNGLIAHHGYKRPYWEDRKWNYERTIKAAKTDLSVMEKRLNEWTLQAA